VFTEEYVEAFDLVIPWGFVYVSGFIALNANLGLQVIREFSVIAKINFFTMLVTVFLSIFLINEFGVYGGLAALGTGNLFLSLFLWLSFRIKLMEFT
jgi:O-antigen/teichoic acid export membrane protein